MCALTLACGRSDDVPVEAAAPAGQAAPVAVATARAEFRPFEYRIEAEGTVESTREAILQFQADGLLTQVNVQNGDRVNANQVLARLDQAPLLLAVERAQQNLRTRQDAYHLALLEAGGEFARPESVPEALRQLLYLRNGVPEAEVNLKEVELQLRRATLRAPFAGTVADLQLRTGSSVTPATPFCYLYDPRRLEMNIDVLESDLPTLRTGLAARVVTLSRPDTSFTGHVTQINPRVSADGRVRIRLQLPATADLLPGMSARAVLQVPQPLCVVVPKAAVVMRSGREVVFVHEDGLAKWHYVTLGRDNGTEVEVLDGLDSNVTVITSSNLQLAHDSPVQASDVAP